MSQIQRVSNNPAYFDQGIAWLTYVSGGWLKCNFRLSLFQEYYKNLSGVVKIKKLAVIYSSASHLNL